MASLEFWYEFASTYSYPAAMRIEALAAARGLDVAWRPFLLGPLFAAQGWRDSPFNLYPVKGRYMWRDMERVCAARGLAFRRPEGFPQNSLCAARAALALDEGARAPFSRAVYVAQFAQGRAIGERDVIASILTALGHDAEAILGVAHSPAGKQALADQVASAQRRGLPGAPCVVTPDGEVFWGDDRLAQAVNWAVDGRIDIPPARPI